MMVRLLLLYSNPLGLSSQPKHTLGVNGARFVEKNERHGKPDRHCDGLSTFAVDRSVLGRMNSELPAARQMRM